MSKPEYMIMNEGVGFALFRKLFPDEFFWYRKELYRLKLHENEFWLRLESGTNKDVLQDKIKELRKSI